MLVLQFALLIICCVLLKTSLAEGLPNIPSSSESSFGGEFAGLFQGSVDFIPKEKKVLEELASSEQFDFFTSSIQGKHNPLSNFQKLLTRHLSQT